MSYLQEAFEAVCKEAVPAKAVFVTLYKSTPFYGGPEEGGWWGTDTEMVASQRFDTVEAAEAAYDAVKVMADKLSAEAKRAYGERCLAECAYLEAHGLDDDFFPEPDGEESFFVVVEDVAGSQAYQDDRHWD